MSPIRVPNNLPELVRTAFAKARDSGHVHFYPTQVALLNVNSVPVRLSIITASTLPLLVDAS